MKRSEGTLAHLPIGDSRRFIQEFSANRASPHANKFA